MEQSMLIEIANLLVLVLGGLGITRQTKQVGDGVIESVKAEIGQLREEVGDLRSDLDELRKEFEDHMEENHGV